MNSGSEDIIFKVFGNPVEITGGFMEVDPAHSKKVPSYAILSSGPQKIVELPSANRKIGIDYVVKTSDQSTKAWYSGEVISAGLEGGYGNRVRIKPLFQTASVAGPRQGSRSDVNEP